MMDLVRARRVRRAFVCHDRAGDGSSSRFAGALAARMASLSSRPVLHLDLTGEVYPRARLLAPDGACEPCRGAVRGVPVPAPDLPPPALAAAVAALARQVPYLVVSTDHRLGAPAADAAMGSADRVLWLTRDAGDLAAWHDPAVRRPTGAAEHVLLLPLGLPRLDRSLDVHRWPVPAPGDALALSRIARRELGLSVGLVLGGGAARGFAHFGVLRVLEAAGVTWDMMGGTSGGGYVSAFNAMGKTIDEAYQICVLETVRRNPLSDVTLPVTALTRGKKVSSAVQRAYGSMLVEDLPVDFFTVASDLISGTPAVLDHGSLAEACLASATLPGIFPPVRRGRSLLVDGGLMQNVPGPVMKSRGADLVIAVDLSSERDVPFEPAAEQQAKSWLPKLFRRAGGVGMKNMLDRPRLIPILMRSLELLMQSAVRGHTWSFDVHIRPQVGGFGMLAWKQHEMLVDRGRTAAEEALPAVHREIANLRDRVLEDVDRAVDAPGEIAAPSLQVL